MRTPYTDVSLGGLVCAGLALLVCGGCKDRDSAPSVASFTESSRVATRDVLKRAGAPEGVGQRAIAATFLDAERVAVLVDGGGPRYVAVGTDHVSETCSTAETIHASADQIAVGCGPLGTAAAAVQLFDAKAVRTRVVELPVNVPPSQLNMSWPVVDAQFQRAALPAGAAVFLFSLGDGAQLSTLALADAQGEIVDVAFSPTGNHLAVAREHGHVDLFDLSGGTPTGKLLAPPEADQGPTVAFSPSGKLLAVASFWGQFRLYAVQSGLAKADDAPGDSYGRQGVTFLGDDMILQIEGGQVVVRDGAGARARYSKKAPAVSPLFGPGLAGGVGFIASFGAQAILTIDAGGETTIVAHRSPATP